MTDFAPPNYVSCNIDDNSIMERYETEHMVTIKELLVKFAVYSVIDEKFWYATTQGADAYIKLGKSSAYGGTSAGKALTSFEADRIVQDFLEVFSDRLRETPVDFISLGIGGADREWDILRTFLEHYEHDKNISFVPVDMSYALLMDGASNIRRKLKKYRFRDKLTIQAYIRDFTNADRGEFGDDGHVRLLTALGIVSNASFPEIFVDLAELLTKNSLLLIDVDTTSDLETLKSAYMSSASKRFFTAPLQQIIDAANHIDEVEVDLAELPLRAKERILSYKGHTLNMDNVVIDVITAGEVRDFCTKHGLPSSAAARIRTSGSQKSQTVVLVYKPSGHSPAPCVLGYSTKFDQREFEEAFEAEGLKRVANPYDRKSDGEKSTVIAYMLKREDSDLRVLAERRTSENTYDDNDYATAE